MTAASQDVDRKSESTITRFSKQLGSEVQVYYQKTKCYDTHTITRPRTVSNIFFRFCIVVKRLLATYHIEILF